MNEVFETVAEVLEELRSEAEEREYSVHTNESENADKALKKANREYETVLAELCRAQRIFRKLYGYSGSRSFSRRTKSLLSGDGRCNADI